MTCANFRIFINLCVLGDALVSRVRANVNFALFYPEPLRLQCTVARASLPRR